MNNVSWSSHSLYAEKEKEGTYYVKSYLLI